MTAEERFWSKVDIRSEDECWPWLASTDRDGYGRIKWGKKLGYQAHRVAYELCIQAPAERLPVCHTCDNRSCCNPKHLFQGTNKINIQDASRKGRLGRGYSFQRRSDCVLKKPWKASVMRDGVSEHLGMFRTEEEARQAYLEKVKL